MRKNWIFWCPSEKNQVVVNWIILTKVSKTHLLLVLHSDLPLKFFLVSPPCLEVLGQVLQFGLMWGENIWWNMKFWEIQMVKREVKPGLNDTGNWTFSKISSMPRFLRLSWLSGSEQWFFYDILALNFMIMQCWLRK